MNKIRNTAFLLVAAVLLISSCNSSSVGLFFSLENVVAIEEEGRGLNDGSPIKSFAEGANNYYLTTSVLKVRKQGVNSEGTTGYTWKTVDLPDGFSTALKVVYDGGTVYLHVLQDGSGGITTGLYSIAEFTYENADNLTWTQITIGAQESDERISNFFIANGEIFVELYDSAGGDMGYRLIEETGGTEIAAEQQFPYLDVEWDGALLYWFITTNTLGFDEAARDGITAEDLSVAPFDPDGAGSDDPLWAVENSGDAKVFGFSGLAYDAGTGNLYLATYGGYVFFENAGWSVFQNGGSAAERFTNATSTSITRFGSVNIVPSGGANFDYSTEDVWVGSRNEGYVIINNNTGNDSVTYYDPQDQTSTNLFSTDLYRGNISEIVYAGEPTVDEKVIFALTPNGSLWRGSIESSQLIWRRE